MPSSGTRGTSCLAAIFGLNACLIISIFVGEFSKTHSMLKHFFLFLSLLLGSTVYAQTGDGDSAARAALEEVVSEVEGHYAGFFDKVTPVTRASYEAMVAELRTGVSSGNVDASIGKYIGWFRDLHLSVFLGGKRLVSHEKKPVNYADSMIYNPSFFSGPVDGDCYLIRIPSMRVRDGARQFIAKAVRRFKRSGCPYLIIDLRGNGGGADGVYNPLVELAYDHAGVQTGAYFRNTGKNRAFLQEGMKENKKIVKAIAACADKPDTLVILREDNLRSFRKVSPYPTRIAVIIDNRIASNAENLILALQSISDRVILYGRDPTLGCVDYVNPRPIAIPSRDMVVHVPTTRSSRLPEHPVDPKGIGPEVFIPLPLPEELTDDIDTWVQWVAEDIKRSK